MHFLKLATGLSISIILSHSCYGMWLIHTWNRTRNPLFNREAYLANNDSKKLCGDLTLYIESNPNPAPFDASIKGQFEQIGRRIETFHSLMLENLIKGGPEGHNAAKTIYDATEPEIKQFLLFEKMVTSLKVRDLYTSYYNLLQKSNRADALHGILRDFERDKEAFIKNYLAQANVNAEAMASFIKNIFDHWINTLNALSTANRIQSFKPAITTKTEQNSSDDYARSITFLKEKFLKKKCEPTLLLESLNHIAEYSRMAETQCIEQLSAGTKNPKELQGLYDDLKNSMLLSPLIKLYVIRSLVASSSGDFKTSLKQKVTQELTEEVENIIKDLFPSDQKFTPSLQPSSPVLATQQLSSSPSPSLLLEEVEKCKADVKREIVTVRNELNKQDQTASPIPSQPGIAGGTLYSSVNLANKEELQGPKEMKLPITPPTTPLPAVPLAKTEKGKAKP